MDNEKLKTLRKEGYSVGDANDFLRGGDTVKFTLEQINQAYTAYFNNTEAVKYLRFGQWFCNEYYITNDQFLFYERDTKTAYNYILANYLLGGK